MTTAKRKPVVVGVDDSAAARFALEWAIDEALVRGCDVRAVVVWSMDLTREPLWTPEEEVRARYAERLRTTIDEVAHGRGPLPRIVPVVVESAPAAGLIEASKDAALLVVARRAGQWVRRALLGSVSSACVKHARVPVVVVPPPTDDPEAAEWTAAGTPDDSSDESPP